VTGRLTVCADDDAGSRFRRTIHKDAAAIPDSGMKEIADTTKGDHQSVHVFVGDVKIAASSK